MKKLLVLSFSFVLCFLIFTPPCLAQEIKQPTSAGTFYPDDPVELTKQVDKYLSQANPEALKGEVFALISPHAGYGYSGPTAAFGYKLVQGKSYKTVIVIGTSHNYGFSGVSIYSEGFFRTPLGDLEIDKDFTKELINKDADIVFDPAAFAKEHSVEVQLPFLQRSLSGFKIVPVVTGDCSFEMCKKLANLLKAAIGSRKDILVVASTDMYHGFDYDEAGVVDSVTLSYLKNMDAEGLYFALRDAKAQLCGGFGVVSTLLLAKELGHDKLFVLKHTNSAEVTGKKVKGIWTVGYASCVIDSRHSERSPEGEAKNLDGREILQSAAGLLQNDGKNISQLSHQKKGDVMLDNEQRKKLLEIARRSIEKYLKDGEKMEIKESDPLLIQESGAFVTLHEAGQLRGCIGNLVGRGPLYLTVRDMAVEAATGDSRFEALKLPELKNIEIEISVLSPMQKIKDVAEIKLGLHGVLVKKGFNSGVFLPQVASETGWSKEEFLSQLCSQKAGLAPDAWKDKSTDIYIFSAEVFSEKE